MGIRRWVLLVLVFALAGVVTVGGPVPGLERAVAGAATQPSSPQVKTSTPVASVGERVYVTGTGWTPVGQTVLIVICGEDARNFSADCNQANQYTAAIRAGGIFYGALTVKLPPTPCPCVFSVTTPGSFVGVKVPLSIVGAPDVPIPPQVVPPTPVALSTQLDVPASMSSWFGGPKSVTLLLSVTNRSTIPFQRPTYVVYVGHGPDPTGFVVGTSMAPLAAGATRVVRVPVTIPPFTDGRYTVRAEVTTGLGSATATVGTTTHPWGLVVAVAVLVLVLVLVIVLRVRRRRARRRRQEALAAMAARTPPVAPPPVPVGAGQVGSAPGYPVGAGQVGAAPGYPAGPGSASSALGYPPGAGPAGWAPGYPAGPGPAPGVAPPSSPQGPDFPSPPADNPVGVR